MGDNVVSVVIPVYNTKRYLEECVRSIMNQTYRNIEILLIDDGSTDGSAALCDYFAEEDSRIRVMHKPNGGLSSTRNIGIDLATGDYLLFVDSDDWLDPEAIEVLVNYARQNDVQIVRFNYIREYANRSISKKNTFLEERVYTGDACKTVRRQILGLTGEELAHPENSKFLASCCVMLYKLDMLKRSGARFIGTQEIGSFEDGLFHFDVFADVKRFAFIDRPYYHYRKSNEASLTANYRENYRDKQLCLFAIIKENIKAENTWDFYNEAFQSHVLYATMEIIFNAMRNKVSFPEKYREVRSVLKHPFFTETYKGFNLRYLPGKWKIYFFCMKHSLTLPTYLITAIILKIKSKGIV